MSRQSHLPPRCPFQMKTPIFPSRESIPLSPSNDNFTPKHKKSVSHSFISDEEPPWLDDILNETNMNSKGSLLCRSISDSVTLLGGMVSDEFLGSNESGTGSESSCLYGPNSPRSRESTTLSENVVVSKLIDNFSQTSTHYPGSGLMGLGMVRSNMIQDAGGSAEVANVETRTITRHSGQRSRVRKLQYIAELERTVDNLQNLQSDLAMKIATLLQHRVTLSMENNTLKQQLASLTQDQVLVEGQYRSLKAELERLKNLIACSAGGNYSADFRPISGKNETSSEAVWEMLDIGNLNLNQ